MAIVKQYFDDRRIALNRELQFHPDLCELLAKHPIDEFEIRLAELAALFGIIVDGDYYPEQLNELCEILTKKLCQRRSGIMLN
jgi:hypothetical protein